MNFTHVDAIVKAVLYEGYILYPYRPSSVKNRQRWTFGGVYPRDHVAIDPSNSATMQTELLVEGGGDTELEIHVRFLHLVRREVGKLETPVGDLAPGELPEYSLVPSIEVGERRYQAWDEVIERDIEAPTQTLAGLFRAPLTLPFAFDAKREIEPLRDGEGRIVAVLIRTTAGVNGEIAVSAEEEVPGVFRVTARIENLTPFDAETRNVGGDGQARAFASTHMIFGVEGGSFVSLLDPPESLASLAGACDNQGTWPVLAGKEGDRDTMLSSPIILYDYPEIAPESPGDLFDATEIDEILTLRILTMTDAEKREMIATDERAETLLERTEALTAEDMAKLHGAMRNPHFGTAGAGGATLEPHIAGAFKPELAVLNNGEGALQVGARVRLRPKPGGDVMDLVLNGEIAIIEAIERDFEDRVHVAVVIEADPGREFGMERMPGHRFFYSSEEIEPVGEEATV